MMLVQYSTATCTPTVLVVLRETRAGKSLEKKRFLEFVYRSWREAKWINQPRLKSGIVSFNLTDDG